MRKSVESLFAVAAPGLETVCAAELTALGLAGVTVVAGGVEFSGDLGDLYRVNLWLRTASRVIVRVGEVGSRDFPDLFRQAVRLPWGKFIRPGTRVRVRAVSRRSRLGHTGRVAETISAAIDRALGRPGGVEDGPEQLVLARFEDDRCLLSVDSSGELLHRRGYRLDAVPAPLRETLAAGLLFLLRWDGTRPLVDPMCGSGTLAIEGALLARRLPPSCGRDFAFMQWPGFRAGHWQVLVSEAATQVRPSGPPILGADLDPAAIAAARGNAGRAGVLDAIEFRSGDATGLVPPLKVPAGLLLCNPPYGARLSPGGDLPALYRAWGESCRSNFAGWKLAFLCPDPRLAQATGLPLRAIAELINGGLPVTLYAAELA